MTKGQPVRIRPISYPGQCWDGVILRKTPRGFSVRYTAFGMRCRETFTARELEAE
jgi:hypothetical protein